MSSWVNGSDSHLARRVHAEFNEVVAGDEFGDGVLDLDPRVDLEEVEISIGVSKEFEGCKTLVPNRLRTTANQDRRFPWRFASSSQGPSSTKFLVAALNRAKPLTESESAFLPSPKNLEFDVLGALNVLFNEHTFIAEG